MYEITPFDVSIALNRLERVVDRMEREKLVGGRLARAQWSHMKALNDLIVESTKNQEEGESETVGSKKNDVEMERFEREMRSWGNVLKV